jgi:hypothetical protein
LLERQQRASGAQRLKNAFDSPWKLRFLTFAQITKKRMARHARTQLHLLFSQLGVFFLFEQTWPSLWNVGTDSARRKSEFGKTRKNFVMVSGGRTPFLGNQKHLFRIRHILHQRDLGMLLTCRSRLHFFTNFWALKPILIWQKMTKECLLEDRLVKTLSLCNAP